MADNKSPFSNLTKIMDPRRFFGRAVEKQSIFNQLAAANPQSVAILGERRIGRSSLLVHIEQTYERALPQPERYHFGYLDLTRDTVRTPEQFYAQMARALFQTDYKTLEPAEFDDLLDAHNEDGRKCFVLLLDEFNVLQRRRDQFGDDFYDGLRSRANEPTVAYVLATHLPLSEIALQNQFTSTFFGIFYTVRLGNLSRDEARELVLQPGDRPLTEADFAEIESWVEREYHPLKLNMAANLIWHKWPYPPYRELEADFRVALGDVFGTAVTQERAKRQRQASFFGVLRWVQRWPEYWFGAEHRYKLLIVIGVVLLLVFGVVTGADLLDVSGLLPDPTPTSTAIPATPTVIPPTSTPIP